MGLRATLPNHIPACRSEFGYSVTAAAVVVVVLDTVVGLMDVVVVTMMILLLLYFVVIIDVRIRLIWGCDNMTVLNLSTPEKETPIVIAGHLAWYRVIKPL